LLDAVLPLLQAGDEDGRRAALARVAENGADAAAMRWVVAELEAKELVEPWLRDLDPDARHGELRQAFLAVAKARRGDLNLALVEDLLSTSFFGFDWWVSDNEATLAFDILTQMPAADVERFRRLEGGGLLRTLYDQLPARYFERYADEAGAGLLRGIEVLEGENGLGDEGARLGGVLRDALKNDPETAGILRKVEAEGVRNSAAAYELLVALSRMAGPALSAKGGYDERQAAFLRRQDRLRAVVRYLDMRRHIVALFDHLGAGTLQDPDAWPMMTAVIAARDSALVEAHARRLLRQRSFIVTYDKVTTEEALLAFQLVRVLPPGRRAVLEAADGGALWERMLGKLTPEMRAAGGLSYALAQPDANGETPLRRRLADPDLWQAENAQQIIVLLELAIASGDYAFAFRASQRYQAYSDPVLLRDVVTPYLLYDPQAPDREPPGERPRISPQRLPLGAPDTGKSFFHWLGDWFRLALGGRWKEGDAVIGLPFANQFDATFDLEQALPLYNDAFADDLLGYGQIADTRAEGQKRRQALTGKNVAQMRDSAANLIRFEFSAERGFARITSNALRLDNAHYLSSGLTVRLGPVAIDDFVLEIGFVGGDLRQPNRLSLRSSQVHAETPVITRDDLLAGARDLQVETLHVGGAWEQAVLPGLLGYLFSMLLDSIPLVGLLTRPASVSEITDDILSRNPMFVSGRLSFSRFSADEIHIGGGQRIGSLTVRDTFIGGAGNRAAQARAVLERDHFAALSRHRAALERLKKARAAGDLERAEQEMAVVEREFGKAREAAEALGRLATEPDATQTQEAELLGKVRGMNRRHENLDEAESKALEALQTGDAVGAKGGAAFFIGAIEVGGIEGDYAAEDLAIRNISGQGESAALVVRQLTTTALLEKFRDPKRPPARTASEVAAADIGIEANADMIKVGGITIRGTIPSSGELSKRIGDLPKDPSYDAERARLRTLLAKVVEYEELHDKPLLLHRNAYFGRKPAEERRLIALERELGVAFGTTVKEASIAGPTLGFGQGDRRVAFGADRVELLGLQRDGMTLDSLVASDIDGHVSLTDTGLRINGFKVGTIELSGLDMLGESSRIWSEGTTKLTGLTADVTIPFLASRQGPLGLDTGAVEVHLLTIAEAHAAKLGYTAFLASTRERYYSVEFDGGVIGGIAIENFKLRTDVFGEYDYTGDITVQTFDKVGFVGGFKSLAEAEGTLTSPEAGAEEKPAITVKFAKDPTGAVDPETGERQTLDVMTIDLNQLLFSEAGIAITPESGSGNVRIRRADLTGKIRMVGGDGVEGSGTRYDTAYFDDITLASIVMSKMRWRSNDGTKIDADGETTIRDVAVTGRYTTVEGTAYIHLDQVHVGSVEAESLYYQDKDAAIWIARVEENPTESGAKLVDISAFDVNLRQDEKGTKLVGGRFAIQQAVAEFALTYGEDLAVSGVLDAKQITLKVEREGERIEARARDIDGDLSIAKGDLQTELTLVDFDTGDIVKSGNVWTVGGEGKDALTIQEVRVLGIALDGPDLKVTSLHGLPAVLGNIRARFDVHMHPDAEAKKEAGTPFEKAVIRELWIDDVIGSGIAVWLKKYNFGLVVAEENDVSLQDVHLAGPLSDTSEPFTITPRRGGGFAVAGQVKTSNLHVDDLYLQLKDRLSGVLTLSADSLDIAFLADAEEGLPFQVDLRNWTAWDILLHVQEDPERALSILTSQADPAGVQRQVSGEWISYDSASGEVIFDRVEIDGLIYDDKVLGVFLEIDKITAPRGNPVILSTSVEREEWKNKEGKLLPGMAIYLERLEIDGADFDIENLSRFLPSETSEKQEKTAESEEKTTGEAEESSSHLLSKSIRDWIDENEALFLSMDLSIQTQGEESLDIPGVPVKVGLNVTFRHGRVNYRNIDLLLNAAPDLVAGFYAERTPIEGLPSFYQSEELSLMAGGSETMRWDIPEDEQFRLGTFREVALHRLLHAQSVSDPESESPNPRELVVEDIEIGLDITNARDLPISLGDRGTIVLDRQGLSSLHIEGDLQRLTDEVVLQHAGSLTSKARQLTKELVDRPGQFRISLGDLRVKEVDLNIPVEDALGPAELTTGGIRVSGVTDTTLDFEGLDPRRLKGRVTEAEANKVRFVMPPAKPKDPGKGGGGKGP